MVDSQVLFIILTKQTTAIAPEVPAKSEESAPKPEPLITPIQQLWSLAKSHDHKEVWGVELADPGSHIPSQIVLQKYLNANDGDLTKAKDQLKKTLDWRKETQPLSLLDKAHPLKKFDGMGFVTTYAGGDAKEVFTWNIYGIVKDFSNTFGDLKE
jgi:phosphatidylinositol transfer protein SFH5